MDITNVKIEELKPYEKNARKHPQKQIDLLAENIEKFGFTTPILIDKTNEIIAGHGRLLALQKLKKKEAPCVFMDNLTDKEVKTLRLADNQIATMGDFDLDLAIEELKELDEEHFDLTGFDKDLLIEPDDKDDEVPEVPEEPKAKLGDIYQLGRHKILCGDATKKEDVEKLMDGKKADMVFTDPPYGIGYEYNSYKDKKGDEYLNFCDKWFNIIQTIKPKYTAISTGWKYQKYWWDKEPKDVMYWLSRNKRTGGTAFHFRKIEPIFIWGNPFKKYDFDFFEQTTEKEKGLRENHTCPKPVSLIVGLIERGMDCKKLVIDLFLGSGSTLIACEKTNRICYGMELDPKYIDVCIQRWEEYTGNKSKKI